MNYKNITLRELLEFGAECPDYSVGDLIYSIFQPVAIANNKCSLGWIREISDEQMFTFVDRAKELEKEEKIGLNEFEIIEILRWKK